MVSIKEWNEKYSGGFENDIYDMWELDEQLKGLSQEEIDNVLVDNFDRTKPYFCLNKNMKWESISQKEAERIIELYLKDKE